MFLQTVVRTDDVELIILPGLVSFIDIHDMLRVVNPEDGVGGVPVDAVYSCDCCAEVADTQ